MVAGTKKYNPGFLSDDAIVASFCIRKAEFASLLESLHASEGNANVHSLVIGPRGSGKTHLLLRVAAEVRRDDRLSTFYPIVFAEESYEVATVGEFWLECLNHLAEQAPEVERAGLRLSYSDLRTTADDRDLAGRCLGTILDFADRHGKRLLVVVENLNMLFADIADPDAGWRLRHTLQTEPRIVLLGSATSRFDEIDHPDHALYDLFRVITLRSLGTEDCGVMWQAITGNAIQSQGYGEIRPLEILTGGNPRLLAIIAGLGANMSFEQLMDNLLELIDDHTEYFKGHLEVLPAQERRVYLALARLWKPARASDVAEQVRLNTNVCSALLKRLVERGAVAIEGGTPRRRRYYLTERLYNVYYLLRKGGGASRVVQELVDFMVSMYSSTELWDAFKRVLYQNASFSGNMPPQVTQFLVRSMMDEANALEQQGKVDQALGAYDEIIRRLDADGGTEATHLVAEPLMKKVPLLDRLGRGDEIIDVCDEMVDRYWNHEDPQMRVCASVMSVIKAIIQTDQQALQEAVETTERALSHTDAVPSTDKSHIEALAMFVQARALNAANRRLEAVALVDKVTARFDLAPQQELATTTAAALSFKGTMPEQVLTESEVTTLLSCISLLDSVNQGSIEALSRFSAVAGVDQALQLIEASGTTGLLFPLVTALQQEMGEETHVAKEVDEVASDVRRHLVELRAGVRFEPPTATAQVNVANSA